MDYHQLEKTTVPQLREMAKEYDDLQGVTGMSKEKLVNTLADKMGIEKPHKVVVGVDKATIKAQIRELKKERQQALDAKDKAKINDTRKQLHRLRHKLHKAIRITS